MTSHQPPLVLTLRLDQKSSNFFNDLRQHHFPAEINFIDAHLTLFHHLPNDPAIIDALTTFAASQNVMKLRVAGLMKLGRGVAYRIESDPLKQLHKTLQKQWMQLLTPQDRQPFRAHITIQNKVDPVVANALFNSLSDPFNSFDALGLGLTLWEYMDGPWRRLREFDFSS
jgi:2'-5' RNA ligase